MKTIETLFLTAKHWQIFLLLFVVPTIGEFAAVGFVRTNISSWSDVNGATLLFLVAMFVYMLSFLCWFWSLGSFLASNVESELRLKEGFFRFALLYPVFYLPAFFWVMFSHGLGPVAVIFPFHLFCMFCLFYGLYFVSKNLVMAETGKPASFYDYAGPLFLMWFYPVGIWFIQPRVNRIYAEKKSAERAV
jgi:hypothetical protein